MLNIHFKCDYVISTAWFKAGQLLVVPVLFSEGFFICWRKSCWPIGICSPVKVNHIYFNRECKKRAQFAWLSNLPKKNVFLILDSFFFRSHERITGSYLEKKVGMQVIICVCV
jgi:hypothetical protein